VKLLAVDFGQTFGSPFGGTAGTTGSTLGDLVSLIVKLGFVVSGILILFFILMAGFQIVAGAGSGNPEAAKKGQQAATSAVIGFVVVFVAYWIVRIIELIAGIKLIS
jgi:hypothetical protein